MTRRSSGRLRLFSESRLLIMKEIRKAIIPIAGLGTRFLPLSKVVPKELWPLADVPVVQKIVEEAVQSGIDKIIFVTDPKNKQILDYFKPSPKIERVLKSRGKKKILEELKNFQEFFKDVSFFSVVQKKPLGDGHALLQAKKMVGQEPVASLFADDIVDSKTPCLAQLKQVFKTCQKPVLSLYQLPREEIGAYGGVDVEKIASRLFKIKKIVEKPSPQEVPSELALVGKHILTPEVFDYLKKAEPSDKGEIILAEVLAKMVKEGKLIYGYQFEGKWLECGDKLKWLKSNLYFSLNHPRYGSELREFLKEIL